MSRAPLAVTITAGTEGATLLVTPVSVPDIAAIGGNAPDAGHRNMFARRNTSVSFTPPPNAPHKGGAGNAGTPAVGCTSAVNPPQLPPTGNTGNVAQPGVPATSAFATATDNAIAPATTGRYAGAVSPAAATAPSGDGGTAGADAMGTAGNAQPTPPAASGTVIRPGLAQLSRAGSSRALGNLPGANSVEMKRLPSRASNLPTSVDPPPIRRSPLGGGKL